LPDTAANVVEADATQLVPTEYRADLVLAFGTEARVIVEAQLHRDDEKTELAVLSSLLRTGREQDGEAAFAALVAAQGLDRKRALIYGDLVLRSLDESARRILEDLMSTSTFDYEFRSEFARKYIQEGREEGRGEGREVGREEGRRAALAQAILTVLVTRGLAVSNEQRTRIEACASVPTLEAWLEGAVRTDSVSDLLRTA
jgi:hypothetical protein